MFGIGGSHSSTLSPISMLRISVAHFAPRAQRLPTGFVGGSGMLLSILNSVSLIVIFARSFKAPAYSVYVKRQWKIAIAGAALIAIVAAIKLTGSEPEYKGRKLSEWISECKYAYSEAQPKEAAQALREMCPTALPTLVDWIGYEKSDQTKRVENFIWEIAEKLGVGAKFDLMTRKGENRVNTAFDAFEVLGTNAAPAIPQLSNMVMNANNPGTAASRALSALALIGKSGKQTIVSLLHDANNPHRSQTLDGLFYFSVVDRDTLIKEINQHLTNSDVQTRTTATNLLQSLRKVEKMRKSAAQ